MPTTLLAIRCVLLLRCEAEHERGQSAADREPPADSTDIPSGSLGEVTSGQDSNEERVPLSTIRRIPLLAGSSTPRSRDCGGRDRRLLRLHNGSTRTPDR